MPTLRELLRAARLLLRRGTVEQELDDELRFHLDMQTKSHVARGMRPNDARALAERELGGVGRVKGQIESVHSSGVPFAESVTTDLRYTVRGLRHSPAFAIGAVVTLALGIGANVTMFAMLDRLLLAAPPHIADPDRLFALARRYPDSPRSKGYSTNSFSYPRYKAIRESMTSADVVMATWPRAVPYGRGADARNVVATLVSGNYFSVLGTRPELGRFFAPTEDHEPVGEPVVVISDGLWRRAFGNDPRVVGRHMEIGIRTFTIIGVAPRGFTGVSQAGTDVWIPVSAATGLQFAGGEWASTKNSTWLATYARAHPGATFAEMGRQMDAGVIASANDPNAKLVSKPEMTRLAEFLRGTQQSQAKVTILLAAVSLLVLLIACANLANLLLARSLQRRREIAVRIALGASRGRLGVQMLIESLALALAGGVAALAVAQWGGSVLARQLFRDAQWADAPVDARVIAYTAIVTLLAAGIAAVVPAFQMSRPDLTSSLKSGTRGGGDRTRTRNALLVVQATLSVLLLVGAGLFVRSLRNVTALDVGIDADHTLLAMMDLKKLGLPLPQTNDLFLRMAERVRALPEVDRVAVAVTVPSYHSYGTSVKIPGRDSIPELDGPYVNAVEPDYFAAIGMRITRGRAFTPADVRAGLRVVVINETLARIGWPGGDPVGSCIKIGGDTLPCTTVVGVAANSIRQSFIEDKNYHLHIPLAQTTEWMDTRVLVIRPKGRRSARLLNEIALTMQTTASRLPFAEVRPLATQFESELRPWRLGATMFGAFGVLALALAAVGLYGVIAFNVARRTHELGVRLALGAQASDVMSMVVRQAVVLAGIGAAVGLLFALAGARFVEPLLFHTSPHDPAVFATVVSMILIVAVAAALTPAWRATRVDPVSALRSD